MKMIKYHLPIVGAWLFVAMLYLFLSHHSIAVMAYHDPDDVMRMLQVKALLNGQNWFDLSNHRIMPPTGANLHWTRIVDLPLAGLMLVLRPILGETSAEQITATITPLLTLLVAMLFTSVTTRRISTASPVLAAIIMALCLTSMSLFAPLRIDHHGWQITALAAMISGITDPRLKRGGITIGIASAISLGIGLEALPYLAIIFSVIGWQWIQDKTTAPRLQSIGITLAFATTVVASIFMSQANRAPRCDALTPVWLTTTLAGGMIAAMLPLIATGYKRRGRMIATVISGTCLIILFAIAWPHCLAAPEGISPLANQLWFQNISEVRTIAAEPWSNALIDLGYPIAALFGARIMLQGDLAANSRRAWQILLIASYASIVLMTWQIRLGYLIPAIAAPGCAVLVTWCANHFSRKLIKTTVTIATTAAVIGIPVFLVEAAIPHNSKIQVQAEQCREPVTYQPLKQLPPGLVATLPDITPWILNASDNSAAAAPYHRESENIVRAFQAFGGDAQNLNRYLGAIHARYVIICQSSEATLIISKKPNSILASLLKGKASPNLIKLPQSTQRLTIYSITYG